MVFVLALGPLLWVTLTIWCLARQATGSKLSLRFFAVMLAVQIIVIALPFTIYHWSVAAAGLSSFAGCPNGQEYCDEFYQLERLGDRMLFHLGAAIWLGVIVWIFAMLRQADVRAECSAR